MLRAIVSGEVPERTLIHLDSVTKRLGEDLVLDGVSLRVMEGETVSITGASGAGKTTLLGILGLLEEPTSGRYMVRGRDTRSLGDQELAALRNRTFGLVFQQFSLLRDLNVWQNVARPLTYAGIPKEKQKARAMALLAELGLEAFAERRPAQLSGGEQQRVAIARALVNDPEVILADEPTAHLPREQWAPVIDTLQQLRERGKSLVIVTHHPEEISPPNRRLVLDRGQLQPLDPEPPSARPERSRSNPARQGSGQVLRLRLLGDMKAVLGSSEVKLTPRLAELLTLLAQHPRGLTGEQLLLMVYGESGRRGTLKTAISRLRELVPIASQPYRIEVPVHADFLELGELIARGDIRAAVELYRGPLLPTATAPAVEELREHLTESLRLAALGADDPGRAFTLAERLEDDLELWEAAAAGLEADDPRRAVALASVERTRRRWADEA